MVIGRKFYSRGTEQVAKDLLGKILVHKTNKGVLSGKIVETEAYFGSGDPASHAHGRKTKRNFLMFGEPGRAYVYFCYGNHWLFNIVAKAGSRPGAVLIRALEPLKGIEDMKRRRGTSEITNLTNGPGKLSQALGIGRAQNGTDLTKGDLFIEDSDEKPEIVKSKRIGITKGTERLLRYYVKNSSFVSKL
jgi:DNA-3-methyladenine glycosylase